MDVTNVNQDAYVDLFPSTGEDFRQAKFSGALDGQADIFDSSTTESTTLASTTESTTISSTTESTTLKSDDGNVDILAVEEKKKQAEKPVDLSSYYENRVKSGKFVSIEEDGDDGKKKTFIPKTAEDFDEVIDIQVSHKLEQEKEKIDKQWYQSKSPAWQAVAKYAELTDDPTEILPFLQGVRTIDSVKDLNPAEVPQAEQIIRVRLQQKGDTIELIDEQIETLKAADKLSSTAEKYKPLILEEERKHLAQMVSEKKKEDDEWNELVMGIRQSTIEAIEAPIYGKQKLKQDEKAAIFSLIGMPSPETKGYPIYTEIDRLFQERDFETLKQVALLLAKKDSLFGYVTTGAVDKSAEHLQRKLRIATEGTPSSSNNNDDDGERKIVRRNGYTSTPRFGRG